MAGKIKGYPRPLPGIFDDVGAIESGMNAHIAKPVQIDNLKSAIQQSFGQNQDQDF